MINWKAKLTSRKFWAAVVGFITPLMLAFGMAETTVTQIVAIVMAGADVIAYIIAEGLVDAKATEIPIIPAVTVEDVKPGEGVDNG